MLPGHPTAPQDTHHRGWPSPNVNGPEVGSPRLEDPAAEQKMLPHLQSPGSLLPHWHWRLQEPGCSVSPQAEVRREQEDAAHKGRGMGVSWKKEEKDHSLQETSGQEMKIH